MKAAIALSLASLLLTGCYSNPSRPMSAHESAVRMALITNGLQMLAAPGNSYAPPVVQYQATPMQRMHDWSDNFHAAARNRVLYR